MAEKKEVIIKVSLEGDAIADTEELSENMKDVKKESKEASETFGIMDTQVGKMATGILAFGRKAVTAFKTLKGAIVATGIGALVVVVVSLIQYFTKTEEGAQKLRVMMAGLGQVVDNIMEFFIQLGKVIVNIFEKPSKDLKKGIDEVGDAAKDVTKELGYFGKIWKKIGEQFQAYVDFVVAKFNVLKTSAKMTGKDIELALSFFDKEKKEKIRKEIEDLGKQLVQYGKDVEEAYLKMQGSNEGLTASAQALADKENALRVDRRNWIVEEGELLRELSSVKLLMDDATKSEHEKLELLNKAQEIQNKLSDEKIKLATEELIITQGRMALGSDSEDDLLREAELKREINDIETERDERLKETADKKSAILKTNKDEREALNEELEEERLTFEEQVAKDLQDFSDNLDKELDLEEEAAKDKLDIAIANKENLERVDDELAASKKKNTEIEIAAAIEKETVLMDLAQSMAAFGADMFEKNKEASQAFMMLEKALAIARIVANVNIALSSDLIKPWMIPVHVAMGAMQIAAVIKSASKAIQESNAIPTPKKALGGWIGGPSHLAGGTTFEGEGGEYIVNKRAMANPAIAQSVINANSGMGGTSPSLTEERVAEIAAQVVRSIKVEVVESESADLHRKVEQRESRFQR